MGPLGRQLEAEDSLYKWDFTLIKYAKEASLSLLPCEHTEGASYEPENEPYQIASLLMP